MSKKGHGRHGARWMALQGLYAWQMSGDPVEKIEQDLLQVLLAPSTPHFDKTYLHELIHQVAKSALELDQWIVPYLDRSLAEMNPVEHSILRIAVYELKEHLETPYKVIINEAILLAKQFGAQDGHKFINGILDKAARSIRSNEVFV